MLQIVPVIELVGMRGREIERGNQQTPAHGILPSHDPQRPQIIRRRVRSGANRLNSRFLLGKRDRWVARRSSRIAIAWALPPGSKQPAVRCCPACASIKAMREKWPKPMAG